MRSFQASNRPPLETLQACINPCSSGLFFNSNHQWRSLSKPIQHIHFNMSSSQETTPLLPQYQQESSSNTSPRGNRPPRTVTFNPLATISTYGDATASDPTFRPLHTGSPPVHNPQDSQHRATGLSALLHDSLPWVL